MTTRSRLLASGPGWRVRDILCTAGPCDPSFEEQYETACIAVVSEGSFQCRSTRGSALLAPGAILLGNRGEYFECGHEHGVGDRCLAFHFAPEHLERIVAAVPGVRGSLFTVPRLPPMPALLPLVAAAEAARDGGDALLFEELALRLAGGAAALLADAGRPASRTIPRDERRITRALRRIEAAAETPLALAELAREAAMSPYHFLRTFRAVVGMTPHQYLLRTRLHRAALRVRRSNDAITAIAFDTGFNDLSTFNRRFRRLFGISPGVYRARLGGATVSTGPW